MALAFQPQAFDQEHLYQQDTYRQDTYDTAHHGYYAEAPVAIPAPIFEHPSVTQARVDAMFRRRRILFALAAVVFAYGLWSIAVGAVNMASAAAPAGTDFTATDVQYVTPSEPAPTYTVQSGDTLWSIAEGLDAGGDLRIVVDQIVTLNDDVTVLKPGQRLVLPYYDRS